MDHKDAVPGCCPSCGAEDHLERASGTVDGVAAEYASPAQALNPEWPWFLQWSVFQFAALACAMLAAMAIGAGDGNGTQTSSAASPALAVGIGLFLLVGLLGVRNTRRNRLQARRLKPRVRQIHEHAVYCSACSCVYFDARDLPEGLVPYEPMPLADYRARLWQACGYVRRL
jgi:hypothetical protein